MDPVIVKGHTPIRHHLAFGLDGDVVPITLGVGDIVEGIGNAHTTDEGQPAIHDQQFSVIAQQVTPQTKVHVFLRQGLRRLLDLHYRYRFDPAGLDVADRDRLKAQAHAWLREYASLQALH